MHLNQFQVQLWGLKNTRENLDCSYTLTRKYFFPQPSFYKALLFPKMTIQKSMKAGVCDGKNGIAVKEVPVPCIKPHHLLIKVEACSICRSDDLCCKGFAPSYPRIPGHEGKDISIAVKTLYLANDRL